MTPTQQKQIEEAAREWAGRAVDHGHFRDPEFAASLIRQGFSVGAQWALQNLNHEETLRLIATGPRPDGTYNYDRKARQQLAERALNITHHESQTVVREPTGEEHGDD